MKKQDETSNRVLFFSFLSNAQFTKTTAEKIRDFQNDLIEIDISYNYDLINFIVRILTNTNTTIQEDQEYDRSPGIILATKFFDDLMTLNSLEERMKFLQSTGVIKLNSSLNTVLKGITDTSLSIEAYYKNMENEWNQAKAMPWLGTGWGIILQPINKIIALFRAM